MIVGILVCEFKVDSGAWIIKLPQIKWDAKFQDYIRKPHIGKNGWAKPKLPSKLPEYLLVLISFD